MYHVRGTFIVFVKHPRCINNGDFFVLYKELLVIILLLLVL